MFVCNHNFLVASAASYGSLFFGTITFLGIILFGSQCCQLWFLFFGNYNTVLESKLLGGLCHPL